MIIENNLPLPHENMVPSCEEERIIAYADKFFSKREEWLRTPKPLEIVKQEIGKYSLKSLEIFMEWHNRYGD
jgi:uncharacterized protein